MDVKTQLIALAVRALADRGIISKPDALSEIFTTVLSGGETYDIRTAKQIEAVADSAVNAAKSLNTRRKFNKIVEKINS